MTDTIVCREIDTYPFVRKKSASSKKLSRFKILDNVYPNNASDGRDSSGVIAFVASGKRFRFGKEMDRNEAEQVIAAIESFATRHALQD